jgi:hypothetical protein
MYGDELMSDDDVLQMWAWRSIRETGRFVMQLELEQQGNLLIRLIVSICMYWQLVSSDWLFRNPKEEECQRTK